MTMTRFLRWLAVGIGALAPNLTAAASRDLGGGFIDHGVATPLSQHRGMVATVDGEGRDVMLVWLYDHRGGYALLMIDAATGKTEQFATPYPWAGDGPFASLLSRGNKYYTHFGSHFSEFDPVKRAFTFFSKSAPQMAMSLAEADDGTIWAATYPNSGVVSFDPVKREFRDHGSVNQENWRQYPRSVAVDDAGWVYVGLGATASQIVTLKPAGGPAKALFPAEERRTGYGTVQRHVNGRVYGQMAGAGNDAWWELYRGGATKVAARPPGAWQPVIAGSQTLFHDRFPSNARAQVCDTVSRTLVIEEPKTKTVRSVAFDYTSEGAHLVAVAAATEGVLSGGTAFPMRMFRYAPATDEWKNWPAYGQFNTVVRAADRFFIGGYGHGFLLEWNPQAEWSVTVKNSAASNPQFLAECEPTINRPHDLLALRDGKTAVLAGTPGYGYTGGGLLFWDRATQTRLLLEHTDLIPQHSTLSLVELPDGTLLGGTTIAGGTGGETKAKLAELYRLDVRTKKITWHAPVLPGAQTYTDLTLGPRGLVYGFADRSTFFVFDPARQTVVHTESLNATHGGVVTGQGPRAFVGAAARDGVVTVLFTKGVAQIDPVTFAVTWLATSPVPITAGGDVLDGRVYFAGGSHLYSYGLRQ